MTEETFGPLVGVAPYDTATQAVEMANDTPYGLASYLYSKNMDKGRVTQSGTHDELLQEGGLYANLYKLQFDDGSRGAA